MNCRTPRQGKIGRGEHDDSRDQYHMESLSHWMLRPEREPVTASLRARSRRPGDPYSAGWARPQGASDHAARRSFNLDTHPAKRKLLFGCRRNVESYVRLV